MHHYAGLGYLRWIKVSVANLYLIVCYRSQVNTDYAYTVDEDLK